jgi:NhaP-type Na+/H+ or K+/H+ antiporter
MPMPHPLAFVSPIASSRSLTTSDLLLVAPLVLIALLLIAAALIDLVRREREEVRGDKLLWAVVIVCIGTIGPIAYFIFGRKEA